MNSNKEYILRVTCPDTFGLVAQVSKFLNDSGLFIIDSAHFGDPETSKFFMRVKVISPKKNLDHKDFSNKFSELAKSLQIEWSLSDASIKFKTAIFVSKFSHCLQDLLYRASVGSLNIDINCVISNHPDLEKIANRYDIPFHHVPVKSNKKDTAEKEMEDILAKNQIELLVLARYMQILSDEFCEKYYGNIINIHHSFLPSFKGAKPYHQAYSKGVKILGATAHYVSAELDEGPIIEQSVDRINHSMTPKEMEIIGRDIESITLAKAVKYHTEQRIFLNENKTVIFN
ncbi:MAG: formyltetrahydrofolate deformylase [Flavobacteriaceae bacterium]|jgi:formyltetrahydrofolate deformylase|nr:formyltetrahydrofolate deformylase [Flavobacteriaceae bacterium]|tara:strand:- start:6598 stop:7458 length:861 start_codon:yes stop_codon:yes gene_type:complete